jgi:hypothetical protein
VARIADYVAVALVVAVAGCTPECVTNNGRPVIAENKAEVRAGLDLPDEPPLSALELSYLVDGNGAAYLPIVRLDREQIPRHGAAVRSTSALEHGRRAVLASVGDADVPATASQAWAGVELVVDGTCNTRVDGFALRRELGSAATGSATGSGSAADDAALADGADLVAHLAGCPAGRTARGAALPAPLVALVDNSANSNALAALANKDLFDTDPGRRHHSGKGKPPVISTAVVMHPKTRNRYVLVHVTGADSTPGAPDGARFQLTGVYQDAGAGDLTRRSVHDRALEPAGKFIDLHGDGGFVMVGDHTAWSMRGTVLAHRGLDPDEAGSAR